MDLERDGAWHLAGAGAEALAEARRLADALPPDQAGIRLAGIAEWHGLLGPGSFMGRIAEAALGPDAQPVRAILFDKSDASNWSLGWHQDRVICVRERREVQGFGPWTRKSGLLHVVPPVEILESMVTLRFHLDDVPAENAPLLIAPASHRLGRVPEAEIEAVVARCGRRLCLAEAGDVWAYATLILHASEAARIPARRRVVQVDYAAMELPGGLSWRGLW